jgi:hypothetical protein
MNFGICRGEYVWPRPILKDTKDFFSFNLALQIIVAIFWLSQDQLRGDYHEGGKHPGEGRKVGTYLPITSLGSGLAIALRPQLETAEQADLLAVGCNS